MCLIYMYNSIWKWHISTNAQASFPVPSTVVVRHVSLVLHDDIDSPMYVALEIVRRAADLLQVDEDNLKLVLRR